MYLVAPATVKVEMLRNLFRTRIPLRRLWIAGDRSSPTHLRLLHALSRKTLDPSTSDLTISYLINSCGLSPAAAISASKDFRLKSSEKADSFLNLLSSHGFASAQIASIVSKLPVLLSYDPDNVKQKLEFFLGAGLSITDLAKILSADPSVLSRSLENRLMPNFTLLKAIFGSIKKLVTALGGTSQLLCRNPEKELLPNMKILQDHGVPGPNVVKLAILYPRVLIQNPVKFSKSVALVKERGFDPSKVTFVYGVQVFAGLTSSTWKRKLQVYQSLGWSEEDAVIAFRKLPYCMLLSDDKIKKMLGFYVEKLNLEPSYVASRPIILSFSFEKRVLPRCMVLSVLESKGFLKLKSSLCSCLHKSEKKFISRYLTKYGGQVPQLLEAYQGKLDLAGLEAVQSVLNPQLVAVNGSKP